MREIKFDAIYKPTGEHFEPYKIDFRDNTTFGNFDGVQNDWCHFSLDGSRGDAILRQYTGLKDSTRSEECPEGIEIYEGDILFDPVENNFFIVSYDESYANFFMKNTDDSLDKPDYDFAEYDTDVCNSLYVVGNIHENPEFIGEKVV